VDESESYGKYLARKHSLSNGLMIAPTPQIEGWVHALREANATLEQAEAAKRDATNHLMALLGDNAGCMTSQGKVAWVRPKPRTHIDWLGIAEHVFIPPEVMAQYTTEKPAQPYVRGWFGKDA